MTGAGGFLEFFILEASEYVERLDGLLLDAGIGSPDADATQRIARALRGTATMAKLPAFAELAGAVEQVGRALQDASLPWDQALRGALVSAIDDLKTLLHSVRVWSPSDDQRAHDRAAELSRYIPVRATGHSSTPRRSVATSSAFLATEAANIAAGVELLATRAGDAETANQLLQRVQALRGVAGVKEVGPLADVLEATEEAVSGVQTAGGTMADDVRQLLEASAAYLRAIGTALRTAELDVDAPSAARDAFVAAQDAWARRAGTRERVVPIEELFYADGAPGLIEASSNPPTSSAERFRLELVSLSEHLRQVVDAARHARDEVATTRARRDLQRALRALQGAAESFGERDVAEFIGDHADSADHVDFLGLAALEDLSTMLAQPGAEGEHLSARLREISGGRDLTSAIGVGFGNAEITPVAPANPTPIFVPAMVEPARAATPTPERAPRHEATPARSWTPVFQSVFEPEIEPEVTRDVESLTQSPDTGVPSIADMLDRASAALIDTSIAALDSLALHPMAHPTPLPEDAVVPIETLLYRGRSALDRAVEIRDEMRSIGPVPDPDALDELFDLLELARAE